MAVRKLTENADPYAGWESRYGRPLSEAERLEIGTNLKGFFGLLHQWHQEDLAKEQGQKGELAHGQEKSPV